MTVETIIAPDYALREQKIHNYGHVRVVDAMGDDAAVVQAARVSYGEGTKTVQEDRGLIRYLMRHRHTTPFEMCEIKLHVKLPIFVARQWIRHRTASVNEYSARYSEMREQFYVPPVEQIKRQSEHNRQGRTDMVHSGTNGVQEAFQLSGSGAYARYQEFLDRDGMARELARVVLPLSTYTEWYWKIDLHNLLHFLSLRLDEHAQWEIRQYAWAIAGVVRDWVPATWEAFEDFRLYACTFSRQEMDLLRSFLDEKRLRRISARAAEGGVGDLTVREWREFRQKIGGDDDDST